MNHTNTSIVYTVNSDLDDEILYAEFDTKDEAIEYAKRNLDKLPFVDELHVSRDANGEIEDVFEYETIWDHTMADDTKEETEDDYWDVLEAQHDAEEDGKHVIGDTTWFESVDNLVISSQLTFQVFSLRHKLVFEKTFNAVDYYNAESNWIVVPITQEESEVFDIDSYKICATLT